MRRFGVVAVAVLLAVPFVLPSSSPAETVTARAHRSVLDQTLPELKFTNVSFKDAVEFLRDVTGANIHVNWRAIEAAGIGQDTNVNVRLRDVPVRKALTLLLSEAGAGTSLTYYMDQGVIEITTREISDKQMFTRVYPVEDLVMEIPDFTDAPSMGLSATATGGSGGGGGNRNGGGSGRSGGSGRNSGSGNGSGSGTSGGFGSGSGSGSGASASGDKSKTKTERGEDLVTLVRETVYPDVWRENGGPASIRYFNGQLIVTAPRSVHEAIGGTAD